VTRETKPAVILLAICAVADIVSTPPLLLASGDDGPPIWLGVVTGVLGVLTAVAAFGVARRAPWAKPLAEAGRVLDVLSAAPGLAAAMPAPIIVSAVIVLSVITIVVVARVDLTSSASNMARERARIAP
jgi:hypothetical protein